MHSTDCKKCSAKIKAIRASCLLACLGCAWRFYTPLRVVVFALPRVSVPLRAARPALPIAVLAWLPAQAAAVRETLRFDDFDISLQEDHIANEISLRKMSSRRHSHHSTGNLSNVTNNFTMQLPGNDTANITEMFLMSYSNDSLNVTSDAAGVLVVNISYHGRNITTSLAESVTVDMDIGNIIAHREAMLQPCGTWDGVSNNITEGLSHAFNHNDIIEPSMPTKHAAALLTCYLPDNRTVTIKAGILVALDRHSPAMLPWDATVNITERAHYHEIVDSMVKSLGRNQSSNVTWESIAHNASELSPPGLRGPPGLPSVQEANERWYEEMLKK